MSGRSIVKKICILGDPAVGKTSLVGRFVLQQFGEEYLSTIGARVCEKKMEVELGGARTAVELVIWDIAGQNQFTSVTPSFYRGAEGALIVCDPSRRETFRNLFRWDHQFRQNAAAPNAVILLNKMDISEKWEVKNEEASSLAKELGYPLVPVSAKTGQNVEDGFAALVRRMMEKSK